MHGADINASICSANESVNNVDSDKENRTRKHMAVERLLHGRVHAKGRGWLQKHGWDNTLQ